MNTSITMQEEFRKKMQTLDNIYELVSLEKTMTSKEILAIIGFEEFLRMYKSIPKECAIISINDPYTHQDIIKHGDNSINQDILNYFDSSIKVSFHDITKENSQVPPITNIIAQQIATFIYANKHKQFVIHCGAGMSRSAGVGKAILIWSGGLEDNNNENEIDKHWRYLPNKLVFKKVLEILKTYVF